jgi:hypothetical protein
MDTLVDAIVSVVTLRIYQHIYGIPEPATMSSFAKMLAVTALVTVLVRLIIELDRLMYQKRPLNRAKTA